MIERYNKLGIKQTIQKCWMDKTVQMLLAGLSEKEIRTELGEFLSTQKQSGGVGERGKKTYGMAVSIMASWFSPATDLISLRNEALSIACRFSPENWIPLHWLIISASYPFWFNVAKQTGRLLNLQEKITQAQIFNRLKEQYGDRETVARNARYVVRSFVAWRVLNDTEDKGCYKKSTPYKIVDTNLAILMIESALHATPEAKETLGLLLNNPAFFPFQLPAMAGDFVSQNSSRIVVNRYGLNDELLTLNEYNRAEQI